MVISYIAPEGKYSNRQPYAQPCDSLYCEHQASVNIRVSLNHFLFYWYFSCSESHNRPIQSYSNLFPSNVFYLSMPNANTKTLIFETHRDTMPDI